MNESSKHLSLNEDPGEGAASGGKTSKAPGRSVSLDLLKERPVEPDRISNHSVDSGICDNRRSI